MSWRRALAIIAGARLLIGAASAGPGVDAPRLMADDPAPVLSAYHLFADAPSQRPAVGVLPYDLQTPLFSDYAVKRRFLFLPPGAKATYRGEGLIDLPVGAVLIKTFAFPADLRRPADKLRLIETRLLIHRPDGWRALPYVWNAEGTEAVLKRAGARIPVEFVDANGGVRRTDYQAPNVNQCKECHSLSGVLVPIGPKARNLNRDIDYPEGRENQLARWSRLGLLAAAPAPAAVPRLARWDDPAEPLAARARAYLDVNCGHCHNPQGLASNSGLDLNLEESDPSRLGVGKRPIAAGRGSGGLLVSIDPGHPDRSILAYRMASTEPQVMMPQIGRTLVDDPGLALIRAYIAAMPAR